MQQITTSNVTINQEPMVELPHDLYIPPDALRVFLEMFEGPLDLLLYLIRKQNLDILQIPIAKITNQYVTYIQAMQTLNIELASEYLLMAAVLLEIKSRILLPRTPSTLDADSNDEHDPRQELINRLIEYEKIKQASINLNSVPQALRDYLWIDVMVEESQPEPPKIQPNDLQKAWHTLLLRSIKAQTEHHIKKQELSIREHMTNILRILKEAKSKCFYDLFDVTQGISYLIVNFIAVLELGKEGMISILLDDDKNIWVNLA
ncbi:MAG: ScpA family protein [Burkholderiales bacterium]|nr:ScpA family protein [Burkholderiales bacterium]